jgi:DNA-binding HxlR family transcriptional regulator
MNSKVDRKRQRNTKTRVEQSSCSLLQQHSPLLLLLVEWQQDQKKKTEAKNKLRAIRTHLGEVQ